MQDDELVQMNFRKDGLAYLIDAVRSFRSGLDRYYTEHPTYQNPFRTDVFDGIMDKLEKADATTQIPLSGIEVRYLSRAITAAAGDEQDERYTALKAIADRLAGENDMETYLMNPHTGTVQTENEWREDFEHSDPDEWGGENFEDATLVPVRRNEDGEWTAI